jgi:hypothetical protein
MRYQNASTEPLEIIRANECEATQYELATKRFQALWNEIERLRAGLEQVAIVCTSNMDRDCNHRMALDFVRQVANDALDAAIFPKDRTE